jgi:DNA-binding response OmpR family regulator
MNTALLVIDDPVVADVLTASLRTAGFHPVAATSLDAARILTAQVRPDVLLVDIDRYPSARIAEELGWNDPSSPPAERVPTIMLTAHPEISCGSHGERCGGTHCARKPVRPRDLATAAARLVRRSSARLIDARWSGVLKAGPIELDLDRFTMTVQCADRRLPFGLGPTVARILCHLMQRPGAVFSREELLAQAWPDDNAVTPRTVDQNIRRLRATLGKAGLADCVRTVAGEGYSLVIPASSRQDDPQEAPRRAEPS